MADENDRAAVVPELVDLPVALDREVEVANRKYFVHEKDVGPRVDGDRKPSRATMPLLYDRTGESMIVADPAELHDLSSRLLDFLRLHTEDRARTLTFSRPVRTGLKPASSAISARTEPWTAILAVSA